jgi:pyruvate-formate lyase-activating enzyme
MMSATAEAPVDPVWSACRFLTCSVLPVKRACNLDCPFCFSKSSISALSGEAARWETIDLDRYYTYARERGAVRLVITGGGEPLLRPEVTLRLIREGSRWFDEIACFTNGACLTRPLARQMADAGLSYLCYSRHHDDDAVCRSLMGDGAPRLADFREAAEGIKIRATCVMARGYIDTPEAVSRYMARLADFGVREFTFKHTYVAWDRSVYGGSEQNQWARENRIAADPFTGHPFTGHHGEVIASLPWGPEIRRIGDAKVAFYYEPAPDWEKENRLCRSINLLSDGSVYASLEDSQSLLYRQS